MKRSPENEPFSYNLRRKIVSRKYESTPKPFLIVQFNYFVINLSIA